MIKKLLPLILALMLLLTACAEKSSGDDVPAPQPEPEVTENDPETPETAEPETYEVENNGGYFVRVDDGVYFRRYGQDSVYKTALSGSFVGGYLATGGQSEIVRYDLNTGKTETVFTDRGSGELYFADGGFYLRQADGLYGKVAFYSLDGEAGGEICPGNIVGVSAGGVIAVQNYEERDDVFADTYRLVKGGEVTDEFVFTETVTFAGVTDEALYLLKSEYDEESYTTTYTLLEVSGDGITVLGTLPEREDPSAFAEVDQFVETGDSVYFVFGYYAGTMHALSESIAVKAAPGEENGLYVFASGSVGDAEGELQEVRLDENGSPVERRKGDIAVGYEEENYGDLMVCDGTKWITVAEKLLQRWPNGQGYSINLQYAEYVGGQVFAVTAAAYRSPLDDIGWREGTVLLGFDYLSLPLDGDGETIFSDDFATEINGNVWNVSQNLAAVLWQQTTDEVDVYISESE